MTSRLLSSFIREQFMCQLFSDAIDVRHVGKEGERSQGSSFESKSYSDIQKVI
jgi:hypothetical protein